MLKIILRTLFSIFYRTEVEGLDNFSKAGDRVLIIANHLSLLDALLIALYIPEKPMFAVNSHIAKKWYVKPFLLLIQAFAIDPANPMATKSIINEVKKDKKCVIFPEGRITSTGSLMKIYEGPGMIADRAGATVLPIRIDGAQYTRFSHLKGKVRLRWFPKIKITVLEPQKIDIDPEIKGRKRRSMYGVYLYDLMSDMLFATSDYNQTIFQSIIEQKSIHGRRHLIAEDKNRRPINYGQLITKTFILGKRISKDTKYKEHVGIMLPNMISSLVTFLGIQIYGRVPTMINYSVGFKNIFSCCQSAKVKTIYTSSKFIEMARLTKIVEELITEGINIVYLEDLAQSISTFNKISGLFKGFFPKFFFNKLNSEPASSAAVILFTSGSEGTPKGVVLSHKNIQANRYQVGSRMDFGPTDIVFNALPIFHSFGLTGGTLLPLLTGIRVFFYPSPLHYRIVPELVYDTNSTIVFGTDTFLSGYARYANPYDFYAVRYVFAGAEKLKDETRRLWSEKYGVRVFEGYGATETSPVLAINTPMHNKPGSVGRLLPGITYEIKKVPGIEQGGNFIVKGPNIMKGYLHAKNPGVLEPVENNTYETGDIVTVDESGYITIQGRAKRFAKIAGEMISLAAIEQYVADIWPESSAAVINIPDERKGEALILVTDDPNITIEKIIEYAKHNGIGDLSVPRKVKLIDKIPLFATGKVDYVSVSKLVIDNK